MGVIFSLIKETFKPFIKGFFFILGIFCSFMLLMIVLGGLSNKTPSAEKLDPFDYKICSDENGKKNFSAKELPFILQIPIRGMIGDEHLNAHTIQTIIESIENNPQMSQLKGILLLINSPGGTAVDSSLICAMLTELKQQHKIPIYAFVEGLSASGAVYISCAADKIYTHRNALVGSVGVLIQTFNFAETLNKIGVQARVFSTGQYKDTLNPTRPLNEHDITWAQHMCDTMYEDFVATVVAARPKLTREDFKNTLGAQVFNAQDAYEYGLIDDYNATRKSTIKEMASELNLTSGEYKVLELEVKRWPFNLLESVSKIAECEVTHKLEHPHLLPESFYNVPLFLYTQEHCH